MNPAEILSHEPRVLTQAQREHYFEHGYVAVESLVAPDVVADLVRVTDEFVDASRGETRSVVVQIIQIPTIQHISIIISFVSNIDSST